MKPEETIEIIAFMEADYAALKYAKLWEIQRKSQTTPGSAPGAASGAA